jgi:arsenite methyltransferase
MCRAELFNKRAASPKSKPDEILKALDLKPGQKVADIGSGGGYFSLRFAEAVRGEGEVFAVDTNADYLNHLGANASKKGLNNIKLVNISEGRFDFPDNYFDLIFLRNVYHHLENRVEYMKGYKTKLKPEGRIAIIEYKPGGSIFSFRRLFGHNVPKEKIMAELEQAGYHEIEEHGFLPEQSFMIFQKNEISKR